MSQKNIITSQKIYTHSQLDDSLQLIYKDNTTIEYVKSFYPPIKKLKKGESYTVSIADTNRQRNTFEQHYGILNNGDIKVFNRFFQLIEYYKFRDSNLILAQAYSDSGFLFHETRYLKGDSIFSITQYNIFGKIQNQAYNSPDSIVTSWWSLNGNLIDYCIHTDIKKEISKRECYYWDDNGNYLEGKLEYLKIKNKFMGPEPIETFELDINGEIIK